MNQEIIKLATDYDRTNDELNAASKLVRFEGRRMTGEVSAYMAAEDRYTKALTALRNAVGTRAMACFISDDSAGSAVDFFKDFPAA